MIRSVEDLPLVRSTTVGSIRIHALDAGLRWLDGGAMFGVVPRPLWERRIAPDERNRIPLAMRCLLESKRGLWRRARAENWLLVFEHDPEVPWGHLDPGEERPTLIPRDVDWLRPKPRDPRDLVSVFPYLSAAWLPPLRRPRPRL